MPTARWGVRPLDVGRHVAVIVEGILQPLQHRLPDAHKGVTRSTVAEVTKPAKSIKPSQPAATRTDDNWDDDAHAFACTEESLVQRSLAAQIYSQQHSIAKMSRVAGCGAPKMQWVASSFLFGFGFWAPAVAARRRRTHCKRHPARTREGGGNSREAFALRHWTWFCRAVQPQRTYRSN